MPLNVFLFIYLEPITKLETLRKFAQKYPITEGNKIALS